MISQDLKWKKSEDGRWLCPFQDYVSCLHRRCAGCGWYPEEAKRRASQLAHTGRVIIEDPAKDRPDWDDQREPGILAYD